MVLISKNFMSIMLISMVLSAPFIECGWFDDLTDTISNGLRDAADFVKEKANPAIKNKTEEIKTTLQDPETYRGVKEWIHDVALPTIKEKASNAGDYLKEEVLPELKKMYEAIKKNESSGKGVEEKVYNNEDGGKVQVVQFDRHD
uniref:Secreted protein n=1 Tax=Rhabditophanes sp. KR3021 TaxID=114890 RepID=A0AC35U6Y6_9BILA